MAGMGNHGRHRHRASTRIPPEASAFGGESVTDSQEGWHTGETPAHPPTWAQDAPASGMGGEAPWARRMEWQHTEEPQPGQPHPGHAQQGQPQWAAGPEWFEAPAQPEPPRAHRGADHLSEPNRQPTYTWHQEPQHDRDPWPGGADTNDAGHWPGQPQGWPDGPGPAFQSYTGHGDVAVGGIDAPERPPLPGRHEVRSSVRKPIKLAIYGLVVGGLVAGTAAWVSMSKNVTLTVDGDARPMHTYAGSVGGVLKDAKLDVGQHDILAPGMDVKVKDGTEIVLRRGRVLRLTVDGRSRDVWVTATSVDEALGQAGLDRGGLWMSASRSKRLPLGGMDLEVRTPKAVSIAVDGHTRHLTSTAATVGDLLDTAKVKVGVTDKVSQLANAGLSDGMTITITRISYRQLKEQVVVKYKETRKNDATLDKGETKVQTTGVDGLQEVTYLATYVNGRLRTRKVVSSKVLTKPVNEVTLVGTKPIPAAGTGGGSSGGPIPSTGGLNWAALADCESSGNPKAVNPAGPYYGLYQFDVQTWQANGGSGIPTDASSAEQTRVANNLYQVRGSSPWPVCGKYL
jgi:resuscitation-promoting factor RpfB